MIGTLDKKLVSKEPKTFEINNETHYRGCSEELGIELKQITVIETKHMK